ncbi:hypothetical protein [Streptomyces sp. ATCC 21386]|uniref:hypothetical protein n=1 Tax=Streptomyces sp. ATCC 21386 TaxID=2699428 RepID=UPI001BFF8812|nr:hypothetical protein [Streptomyces sp. ATCC 21386]
MPTSVLIAVALSVLLGILVIMLRSGGPGTDASTAADPTTIDAAAADGGEPVGLPRSATSVSCGSPVKPPTTSS